MKYISRGQKIALYVCIALIFIIFVASSFLPIIGFTGTDKLFDVTLRVGVSPFNVLIGKTETSPKVVGFGDNVDNINSILSFTRVDISKELDEQHPLPVLLPISFLPIFASLFTVIFTGSLFRFIYKCSSNPTLKNADSLYELDAFEKKFSENIFIRLSFSLGFLWFFYECSETIIVHGEVIRGKLPADILPFFVLIFLLKVLRSIPKIIFEQTKRKAKLAEGIPLFVDPAELLEQKKKEKEAKKNKGASVPTPTTSTASPTPPVTEEKIHSVRENAAILAEYKQLLEDGVISEEEYNQKKKELLKL